jgi:hypothetical protein
VNQFFGTLPQAVIQPDAKGRLAFDAPNRFLFWRDFELPWKLTVIPVYDLHSGFPYSVENVLREYAERAAFPPAKFAGSSSGSGQSDADRGANFGLL